MNLVIKILLQEVPSKNQIYKQRACLDYGDEAVHRSRILGAWSNLIGYKKASSPSRVYTTTKTSLVESSQTWMKNQQHFLLGNLPGGWSFLGNLKPLDKKLGLWRTPTRPPPLFFLRIPLCLAYQSFPQKPCLGLKFLTDECNSPL